MKKSAKLFWLTIAAALALGMVLMMVGYLSGGGTWLYVDSEGIHVGQRTGEGQIIENYELPPFTNVQVEGRYADIVVTSGSRQGIHVSYFGEKPDFRVDNGTLLVEDRMQRMSFNIGFPFGSMATKITIFCGPDDIAQIKVSNDLGDVEIKDIFAQKMTLRLSSGDAEFSNVEAETLAASLDSGDIDFTNSKIGTLDVKNHLGSISAVTSGAREMKIKNNSGDVDVNGDFGTTVIESDLGDVHFETSKPEAEFRYELKTSLGDISIGDSREFGSGVSGGSGQNSLFITLHSGDIDVFFGD